MWELFPKPCCKCEDPNESAFVELDVIDYRSAFSGPLTDNGNLVNQGVAESQTVLSKRPPDYYKPIEAEDTDVSIAGVSATSQPRFSDPAVKLFHIRNEVNRTRELLGLPLKQPFDRSAAPPRTLPSRSAGSTAVPGAVAPLSKITLPGVESRPVPAEIPASAAMDASREPGTQAVSEATLGLQVETAAVEAQGPSEVASGSTTDATLPQAAEAQVLHQVTPEEAEVQSRRELQKQMIKDEVAVLRERVRKARNDMLAEQSIRPALRARPARSPPEAGLGAKQSVVPSDAVPVA